ncbi:hypothetical protein [Streptomyces sp. NPDC001970]
MSWVKRVLPRGSSAVWIARSMTDRETPCSATAGRATARGRHRVEAGELLLVVVSVHGGLRNQLIEFRVTQLSVGQGEG